MYGTDTGRMCVAALNSKNIDYVCQSDCQGHLTLPLALDHNKKPPSGGFAFTLPLALIHQAPAAINSIALSPQHRAHGDRRRLVARVEEPGHFRGCTALRHTAGQVVLVRRVGLSATAPRPMKLGSAASWPFLIWSCTTVSNSVFSSHTPRWRGTTAGGAQVCTMLPLPTISTPARAQALKLLAQRIVLGRRAAVVHAQLQHRICAWGNMASADQVPWSAQSLSSSTVQLAGGRRLQLSRQATRHRRAPGRGTAGQTALAESHQSRD